jgi:hypothetical protein
MESQVARRREQERQQIITSKFRRGNEGTLREDRHTEDPSLQVQGVGSHCRAREGKQRQQLPEEVRTLISISKKTLSPKLRVFFNFAIPNALFFSFLRGNIIIDKKQSLNLKH